METYGSLTLTRRSGNRQEIGAPGSGDRGIVEEKAFYDLVANATREGVRDTLGPDVAAILESKGFLENLNDPVEFDRQLTSVFGNGAKVLERLVVKELYHELGIGYNSQTPFNYRELLDAAKEVCFVRSRVK
jgi:hypothetical protein